MEDQRPKAELLLGDIGQIGAIDPSTHANDAVEIMAFAGRSNAVDHAFKLGLASFICMPGWQRLALEGVAMVANPVGVEGDLGVCRIHHADRTDLVWSSERIDH